MFLSLRIPSPILTSKIRIATKITVDGLKLTKVNPAYMTRQMGEIAFNKNLVSLPPHKPQTHSPAKCSESWELQALNLFSSGTKEYATFTESDSGSKLFRYMAPLWVERSCLKCHAKQGYKENDLRGGISVTIQADPINLQNRKNFNISLAFILIWGLGLIGISLVSYRLTTEEKNEKTLLLNFKRHFLR